MFKEFPEYGDADALIQGFLDRAALAKNDHDLKKLLHESGILWAWIPKWMGGLGFHPLSTYSFAYQVSQYSLGLTNIVGAHYAALGILSSSRAYSQIRNLVHKMKASTSDAPGLLSLAITEPNAGSDFENAEHLRLAKVMTTATRTSSGFEVSGQKIYVSNGPWAKWAVFSAYLDGKRPLDTGILGWVDLRREGISLGKKEQKLGQNVCPNCMLFFDRVQCTREEIFGFGNPNFSRYLIEESLGSGRAMIAMMAIGVMRSLERFGNSNDLKPQFEKMEKYFTQLKKTHLSYRDLSAMNNTLNALTNLPGIGGVMKGAVDAFLGLELKSLNRKNSFKRVEGTFKLGSLMKAEQTQNLQNSFEKILDESSYLLLADPFFKAQLKDSRLLEIIEGTTEVCLKDAGVPITSLSKVETAFCFGFLNLEAEKTVLQWIRKDKNAIEEENDWVKSFFDSNDRLLESSILYAIAFEFPEKALQFYLKALKVKSKVNGRVFIDRKNRLFLTEAPLKSKSLQFLAFPHLCWIEMQESAVVGGENEMESYLFPVVLLGAADRALEYAENYSRERYQGGKIIGEHHEIAQLLQRSGETLRNFKNALKIALETRKPLERALILPFFRLARDTAQVLGGMSYMEEHPISRLYLEIITLAHLSLQK